MQKLIPFIVLLAFTSCSISRPLRDEPSNNNETYKVQYLFEHEGCKVYRFYDRGNYVYFTNCRGESMAVTDSSIIRNSTNLALKYPPAGANPKDPNSKNQ
ncbi:DUF4884 domain-containing protein [Paraflavitalea speifideaquila]|uniref:DUF4884 domain-containing protein n=1 Tax=Paraflavitalea speifideaquila TaxID=3076558 RepID=UPI0028E77A92|nr:DUF4884 domain-containing protein [Paraflavitalea speifideiaquila]